MGTSTLIFLKSIPISYRSTGFCSRKRRSCIFFPQRTYKGSVRHSVPPWAALAAVPCLSPVPFTMRLQHQDGTRCPAGPPREKSAGVMTANKLLTAHESLVLVQGWWHGQVAAQSHFPLALQPSLGQRAAGADPARHPAAPQLLPARHGTSGSVKRYRRSP